MDEIIDMLQRLGITDLPSTVAILLFVNFVIRRDLDARLDKIEGALTLLTGVIKTASNTAATRSLRPCSDSKEGSKVPPFPRSRDN